MHRFVDGQTDMHGATSASTIRDRTEPFTDSPLSAKVS